MKNLILLAVFALATACSSNPRYNAIKEYNELQFSRCIEKSNTDFIANKTGSKEYLLLRITSVSGAPAEKNFASQSSADFNTLKAKKLSDLEAKWKPENSQVSEYKASKVQFSGTSALRVENIIQPPDGSRFFDIEYTIYGPSATITAGVTQNISKESLDSAKLEKILAGLSVLAK
jgi:hypothetical protein